MSDSSPKPGLRTITLLKAMLVLLLLTSWVTPAWTKPPVVQLPPPVAVGGPAPAWTVVPSSPKVLYAPNTAGDVFRFKKKVYYYQGGVWYRSKHLKGPWHPVRKLPKAITLVNGSFFKSSPPW
jgi:hypothetical protein